MFERVFLVRSVVGRMNAQQRGFWETKSDDEKAKRAGFLEHRAGIYAERGDFAKSARWIYHASILRGMCR